MPKENQSDGRAHDCDHEQIFCAHGHIHAHRKSRVIGVLMAMCTSKPIIGKRAPWGAHAPHHPLQAFHSSVVSLCPYNETRPRDYCLCLNGTVPDLCASMHKATRSPNPLGAHFNSMQTTFHHHCIYLQPKKAQNPKAQSS